MGRKVAEKYILFTGDAHENVKFDFTHKQIEIFISLWNAGVPIDRIAKKVFNQSCNCSFNRYGP